jgi:hypothetical protein
MNNVEIIETKEFNKQFSFLTTCLGRTKDLYDSFKDEIKDDNSEYALRFKNAPEQINAFYADCLNIIFDSQKKFSIDFNIFYELAPSYEEYSTVYSTIATQIALMCTSIGEFYESKNIDVLIEVLMNFDEVINIVKSEEFNNKKMEGDSWDYVESFLKKEYIHQLEIIKVIDNTDLSRQQLQELVNKYEITF